MTVWRSLTCITCLFFSAALYAADDSLPFAETNGCMEGPLAQFGRYIGDWKIEDSQRSRDDGSWSPGKGARWVFSCLGNGTAIQDFWYPATGNIGTNFPPDETGWNWKLEFSQDDGETWTEVYRIRATPH